MSGIVGQIGIICFLIAAIGFFALSEAAVIAARKSQLRERITQGNRRAKIALHLALAPNRSVLVMRTGMTLLVLFVGMFAGRNIVPSLSALLTHAPIISGNSDGASIAIVILFLTYFALLIGELVPKRVALSHAERIVAFLADPIQLLTWVFSPMTYWLAFCADAIAALFARPTANQPDVTEDEIKSLVKQGTEAGVFQETEQDMLEAVLRLGDKRARSLMTPRTQIAWLDLTDSTERTRAKIISSGHSCFPVATGSLDRLDGVVQSKDLLARSLEGHSLDLRSLMHQPLFVPRTVTAIEVLESFKDSGQHIALVVDEYGGIEGLLTDHDILEAIAGDIPFDGKPNDPKAVRRHDGSWLLDGMLSIDEFKEIFQLDALPGEKRDAYQTLGGFVFTRMGQIPSVSDFFAWNGLRFEVVDMDGKRIDKVMVSSLEQSDTATNNAGTSARSNDARSLTRV